MRKDARMYVAGHRGLVGSAIVRCLDAKGHENIITRNRADLDLRDQDAVDSFFRECTPEYVFLAAAKVGGIQANSRYPADFICDNIRIEANVVHAAHKYGVKKLLFLGSSCIYPRMAPQPLREEYLLTGALEETNESYAVAKIGGIKLCQAYRRQYGDSFIAVMPTNLYGINDNFDLDNSHVVPALIRKFHEAKTSGAPTVVIWGSGSPRREFLFADDLAEACCHLMAVYDDATIVNIGTGQDLAICEVAEMIKDIVGYIGELVYDTSKPDGTPRKVLDISRISMLGWKARTSLREGLEKTYQWFLTNKADDCL